MKNPIRNLKITIRTNLDLYEEMKKEWPYKWELSNPPSKDSFLWDSKVGIFASSKQVKDAIEEDYLSFARKLFEMMMNSNSTPTVLLNYVFTCEKINSNVWLIIFIFKQLATVIDVAIKEIEKKNSKKYEEEVHQKVFRYFDTNENLHLLFKFLCQDTNNTFYYYGDVLTPALLFLSKLLQARPQSVQKKMMTLFEKRIYAHKFFKKLHTVLTSHTIKLNSGNFIPQYAQEADPNAIPAYMIDDGRQKQVLAVISSLCSQHNYIMKDYMRKQTHSSKNYNLVKATMKYLHALLPYMCYGPTYELLLS